MTYATYKTLGDAKHVARINAKRDECDWYVWHNWSSGYFIITDQFAVPQYYWDDRPVFIAKFTNDKPDEKAVVLTDKERQLVAAVLDPSEPGRDYYPGNDDTKRSLWQKMLGKK